MERFRVDMTRENICMIINRIEQFVTRFFDGTMGGMIKITVNNFGARKRLKERCQQATQQLFLFFVNSMRI